MQIGVVAPSAFSAFTTLSPLCTSLDVHGDHWEMGLLTQAELSHLGVLTNLVHLGIYHYEIAFRHRDNIGVTPACAWDELQPQDMLEPSDSVACCMQSESCAAFWPDGERLDPSHRPPMHSLQPNCSWVIIVNCRRASSQYLSTQGSLHTELPTCRDRACIITRSVLHLLTFLFPSPQSLSLQVSA